MLLDVPTTWDDSLLDSFAALNEQYRAGGRIDEVYGSLPGDPIGSVKEAHLLPQAGMERLAQHVRRARSLGISVAYVANSNALTPEELSSRLPSIRELFSALAKAGVAAVILSDRRLFAPASEAGLAIDVSAVAEVRGTAQARRFERMGVRRIKLSTALNRNFHLIGSLAKALSCGVELLLNEDCLYQCHWRTEHFFIQGRRAAEGDGIKSLPNGVSMKDYPYSRCGPLMFDALSFPAELLKSRWIRPEDVRLYEDTGVTRFKLTGRTMSSGWIATVAERYLRRAHEGNVLDIMPLSQPLDDLARGFYLENASLEGFVESLQRRGSRCDELCGDACVSCHVFARRLVESGDARVRRSLQPPAD